MPSVTQLFIWLPVTVSVTGSFMCSNSGQLSIAKIKTKSGPGFQYKALVRKNGTTLKIKTFAQKTDALTWTRRIEADHELMEAIGCRGASLTLKELADEYVDQWRGKDPDQLIRVAHWTEVLGSAFGPTKSE